MVAVIYGVARVPTAERAAKPARKQAAAPGKSWLARVFEAMIEARMASAQREIRMHAHLLPLRFDERGNRLIKAGSGDTPFGSR